MNTKKKLNGKKRLTKAVSIIVMGAICITTAISVAALSKTVTVTDGENTVTINTINANTQDILNLSGIKLGENDKLVRTEGNGNNISISILRAFNVDVVDGDTSKTLTFNEGTVADALKAAGMTLSNNDVVSFSANTELEPDMEIKVTHWYTVNIDNCGEKITKQVPAGTVSEILDFLNIKLGKNDVLVTDKNKKIEKDNMNIVIQKVTYKEITTEEEIEYKTINKDTDNLYKGETEVEKEGKNGIRTIVTRQKYINDKFVSDEEISNEVTTKPVDKVVLNGTAEKQSLLQTNFGAISVNETSKILTDVNGNQVSYSHVLTGSGTAYTSEPGAITSTGRVAQYGVVAVNPNVIPYGSQLYIVSNDGAFVYGYAVAGDTGGAMMAGDAICDLYYPNLDDCIIFGRRDISIYVLN